MGAGGGEMVLGCEEKHSKDVSGCISHLWDELMKSSLWFTAYLIVATREGCCNSQISFKHWIHTTIQPHSVLSLVSITLVLDGLHYSNIDVPKAWKSCIQLQLQPLSEIDI